MDHRQHEHYPQSEYERQQAINAPPREPNVRDVRAPVQIILKSNNIQSLKHFHLFTLKE